MEIVQNTVPLADGILDYSVAIRTNEISKHWARTLTPPAGHWVLEPGDEVRQECANCAVVLVPQGWCSICDGGDKLMPRLSSDL